MKTNLYVNNTKYRQFYPSTITAYQLQYITHTLNPFWFHHEWSVWALQTAYDLIYSFLYSLFLVLFLYFQFSEWFTWLLLILLYTVNYTSLAFIDTKVIKVEIHHYKYPYLTFVIFGIQLSSLLFETNLLRPSCPEVLVFSERRYNRKEEYNKPEGKT